MHESSHITRRRASVWTVLAIAAAALLGTAGTALGQGLPGGPDLPPPDPTPAAPAPTPRAPTPAPSAPASPSTGSPRGDSGASAPDQAADAEAEAARRAAAQRRAAARRAALARERAERLRRARAERAREFRNVTGFSQAQVAISDELEGAVEALGGLAVTAAVSDVEGASTSDDSGSSPLVLILLAVSALSALLVAVPRFARLQAERAPVTVGGRVGSYVADRIPLVQAHRLELAGVAVGCLLVALLLQVGAI